MKKLLFLIAAGIIFTFTFNTVEAQAKRDLLSGKTSAAQLKEILIPQDKYHPFPTINERKEWENIPAEIKKSYIKKGEKQLGKQWEILPASVFLDYKRNGNRTRYEDICFGRRQRLMSFVLAEIFENKGRFLDEIANGIWLVCEETYWGIPAHVGAQTRGTDLPDVTDPTIDLFAAETGAMLAYVDYLMGDKLKEISPLLPERINYEENRRIITPYFNREAWWKTGTNNWNPWVNSNVLAVLLFLEKDNTRRCGAIYKTMQSVDYFINNYPEDGGCDEGPNYWTRAAGCLFDYLELLYSASDGKINLYGNPLVKKMGQFIYTTWVSDNYFINFADASAKSIPNSGLVYRFGKRINDPVMMGFGAMIAQRAHSEWDAPLTEYGSLNVTLPNLFVLNKMANEKPVEPYTADTWLPDLQVMAARSYSNSSAGFYLAAKGGHNAESHNHNDVGNFIVYHNGKPVLIDVGVGTYTSKTFSSKRYEIWTMQSQYHNLPTINGVQQKDGKNYRAENVQYSSDEKKVDFSLQLAKCYPAEAMLNSWERNIELLREKKIILSDNYNLKEWKAPLVLNLMTVLSPDCRADGKVILSGTEGKYEIKYDKNKFSAASEEIKINDARLSPVWGNKVYRVTLTANDKKLKDNYKIELTEAK
jgi:hypothetical protein